MTSAFLWISLKTSRSISARFSKMPERCVAARCGNIKDEANGISMHRIPTSTWKIIRSNVCENLAIVLTDDNDECVCKMQGENFTIH